MASLPPSISSLSYAEKFELLDALWADLEANASTLSAEQAAELDRRADDYERNPSAVIPWEQVKAGSPKQ